MMLLALFMLQSEDMLNGLIEAWIIHTFSSVQCARNAARNVGLTAVPVSHGMLAVVTTHICLHANQHLAEITPLACMSPFSTQAS